MKRTFLYLVLIGVLPCLIFAFPFLDLANFVGSADGGIVLGSSVDPKRPGETGKHAREDRPSSISISTLGTPITQNFNTLSQTGTSNAWSDDTTLPGWYAQFGANSGLPTTYRTGNSGTGGIYSYGISGVNLPSDRALGSTASGTTGEIFYALKLVNDTGATITSLDISFTGEQWRGGGCGTAGCVPAAQQLDFQYQKALPGVITDANSPSTGWVDLDSLDFITPVPGTDQTAFSLDGNAEANRTAKSATLSLSILAGEEIWLRWRDSDDASNDHAVAIDDLSITPNGTVGSPGTFSWTEDFPMYGEESGVKVFTIQRTGGSAGTASVTVNTSDVTAAGGAVCGTDVDYVAVMDGVVTFLDGETSKTVNVTICNDALYEGDEVFDILLSNPTGGAAVGLPAVSQSTIVDDDIPSAQFGATAYAGREGGTASVTVTRTGATNATADVNFTTGGGTAVSGTCGDPGVDFFPASGVVQFDAGESAKDITFTFCSDGTNEPAGETFDVNLTSGIDVVIGSPATATVTILEKPVNGMWVFGGSTVPDPVSDPAGRSNMIVRSSNDGVSELYVSVYQSTDNANGRRMYEDDDMAAMISAAHLVGQEVWAAYGAPDWPTFGCTAGDFPVQRMAEVAAYNASRPANERFDGVMLDVEPAPASEAEFQALIAHYECMRASLPVEVKLGAAINAFWDDDPVTYPVSGGSIKPASEHIIDLDLDRVIVLGYRDAAGTDTCPSSNGIICLDKAEIDYAGSIGKVGVVLAGLETKLLVSSTGTTGNETFYEEGNVAMDNESSVVENYFAGSTAFGGFAIHNYADAYLGGDTGWPLGPTAAPASISGRVMTADGSGLRNATVTIQGGNLAGTRNVATSTFGYFRFDGLEAGLTYVVTVSSRRYSFTQPTRLVNLTENVEGLDFVASP